MFQNSNFSVKGKRLQEICSKTANPFLSNIITPTSNFRTNFSNNLELNASPLKCYPGSISSYRADTACATETKRSEIRSLFREENVSVNQDRYINLFSVKKANETKPSLNISESKNLMFYYSKSSKYTLDKSLFNGQTDLAPQDVSKEDTQKLDFRLKIEELIKQLPVPLEKKNDEKFKIKAMRQLRNASLPPNQSAKNSNVEEYQHQKIFRIDSQYSANRKRRFSSSVKKFFSTDFVLKNKNEERHFPLYKDEDIGVNMYWQSHIIESNVDEDVDTDNDQIKIASLHTLVELREAIQTFCESEMKILRNRSLIKFK